MGIMAGALKSLIFDWGLPDVQAIAPTIISLALGLVEWE